MFFAIKFSSMSLAALTSDHQQGGVANDTLSIHFEIICVLQATTLRGLLALISSKMCCGKLSCIGVGTGGAEGAVAPPIF